MSHQCTNCEAPDAKSYELLLRSDGPTTTYLCDDCRDALQEAVDMP